MLGNPSYECNDIESSNNISYIMSKFEDYIQNSSLIMKVSKHIETVSMKHLI